MDIKELNINETIIVAAPPRTVKQLYNRATKLAAKQSSVLYPILPIKVRKQTRETCLLLCIVMVADYYGIVSNEQSIINAFGDKYSDEEGTYYEDAFNFLKNELGLDAKWSYKKDSTFLRKMYKEGIPVIYDLRIGEIGHAVVFCGIDDKWIYFADSAVNDFIKMPITLFDQIVVGESAACISVKRGNIKRIAI